MPDAPTTKAAAVMREFAGGSLRSGSKAGPVVTDPAQAKAIAMSESGQSRPERRATRGSAPMTAAEIARGFRRL